LKNNSNNHRLTPDGVRGETPHLTRMMSHHWGFTALSRKTTFDFKQK